MNDFEIQDDSRHYFTAPKAGRYQLSIEFEALTPGQSFVFGNVQYKRRIIYRPRWWEFWRREIVEEEILPAEDTSVKVSARRKK